MVWSTLFSRKFSSSVTANVVVSRSETSLEVSEIFDELFHCYVLRLFTEWIGKYRFYASLFPYVRELYASFFWYLLGQHSDNRTSMNVVIILIESGLCCVIFIDVDLFLPTLFASLWLFWQRCLVGKYFVLDHQIVSWKTTRICITRVWAPDYVVWYILRRCYVFKSCWSSFALWETLYYVARTASEIG